MPKETMTSKERWLRTLKREKVDRIPMDYWATGEVNEKLMKHFRTDDMDKILKDLHVDLPVGVGASYKGPKLPPDTNVYGLKYRMVDYGTGAYSEAANHPLAEFKTVEEIKKNYKWPSPDWYDYSGIKKQIEGKDGRVISGGGSEPFLLYKWLRGDEQAFIDLIENPDIVHYCMGQMYELAYQNTLRIFEQIPGKVDITYIAEDVGGQEDLLYSPQQIREFFFPHMKRMIKLTKEAGSHVFYHSDGAIRKIIPGLIEIGIDVLNPIQWRCKDMDKKRLMKDYGDKLVFHSAVENQKILPFGTVEEVRKEVIENIEIFGQKGGYILGPCHNLQAVTPVENIIEMYKTGYEYGWR